MLSAAELLASGNCSLTRGARAPSSADKPDVPTVRGKGIRWWMLGEFFVASSNDVERFVEEGPFDDVETVEAKGLTEVSLATLGEILDAGRYHDLVLRIADGLETEHGEAGVLPIPAAFRDALAGLDSADDVAERWAATDELTRDEWTSGDAVEVLRDLSALARRATQSGRHLWYWWSV